MGTNQPETTSGSPSSFTALMCDGCCCGTTAKHPDVDHEKQREQLQHAARSAGGKGRVVDCLGECYASNVVVIRRPAGALTWLGWLTDDQSTQAACRWIADGADVAELPDELFLHVFERSKASGEPTPEVPNI